MAEAPETAGVSMRGWTSVSEAHLPPTFGIVLDEPGRLFDFHAHFHPYVEELRAILDERGLEALESVDDPPAPGAAALLQVDGEAWFRARFAPIGRAVGSVPSRGLDTSVGGPYAIYNWEIFFHLPVVVARHLSAVGRFADAQRWFHLVFDPTADDAQGDAPDRFWRSKPLRDSDFRSAQEILLNLATGADARLQQETLNAIRRWERDPFAPHLVAAYRPGAYAMYTVMAYLDNLISWGDSLFMQGTRETINDALQLYVLAGGILGARPQPMPARSAQPLTYAQLRGRLDAFGNALVDLEAGIPLDLTPPPSPGGSPGAAAGVRSVGRALYFCVPVNDRLLGYWDTVADRLYKIRNSLDIRGVFRQLPLFAPPIDPGMLAKAAAAGVDIDAVLSGASQPLPLVRAGFLIRKALELAQELGRLSSARLSYMEKEDAEGLAALRAGHERATLEAAETVRYEQLQEATKGLEGVKLTFAAAVGRYQHYGELLGKAPGELRIDELDELDVGTLEAQKFAATEPAAPQESFRSLFPATGAGADPDTRTLSDKERTELGLEGTAGDLRLVAGILDAVGSGLAAIPTFTLDVKPIGLGAGTNFGGPNLQAILSAISMSFKTGAEQASHEASRAGKMAGYERREQEWVFQKNVAAAEITQVYKQLRAAQLRVAIADRELRNHRKQILQAKAVEAFLTDPRTGKTTQQSLYTWMKREVQALEGRCRDLAVEFARKAERAVQHELGRPDVTFVDPGYGGGRLGLLGAERLTQDIQRMEATYHELNEREYERTRHVSLNEIDPLALVELRATGRCRFTIPEEILDLDGAEYFRRLRSFAVSIPCVTGPYVGVACRVSRLSSRIRTTPRLLDGVYAWTGPEDPRFDDTFGSVESVVTSTGTNDTGLFETGDERRLPGEGYGPIGEWSLDLPAIRRFDYGSISDVILHVRYTAREGGDDFRAKAVEHIEGLLAAGTAAGATRLFSLRHEFPDEWGRFRAGEALAVTLGSAHFPYWSRLRLGVVAGVQVLTTGGAARQVTVTAGGVAAPATALDVRFRSRAADGVVVRGGFPEWAAGTEITALGDWSFALDGAADDVLLAVTWGKAAA